MWPGLENGNIAGFVKVPKVTQDYPPRPSGMVVGSAQDV